MTDDTASANREDRGEAAANPGSLEQAPLARASIAEDRRLERFAIVAKSPGNAVVELWQDLSLGINFSVLRGPEFGSVMLRGRIGGGGSAFNLGEATVTRASVKTESGAVGHFMTLGRDKEKARIGALIDAVSQHPEYEAVIERAVIAPLRDRLKEADDRKRAEVAATKVEFFTMVRGED